MASQPAPLCSYFHAMMIMILTNLRTPHSVPELLKYGNKILTQLIYAVGTSSIPHMKEKL